MDRAWKAKDAEDRDAPTIARRLLGVVVRAATGVSHDGSEGPRRAVGPGNAVMLGLAVGLIRGVEGIDGPTQLTWVRGVERVDEAAPAA